MGVIKKPGKKNEVLSGQHQMHQGEELKDITAEEANVDTERSDKILSEDEKESKQIIAFLIKHILIDCQKEIRHNDSQKSIVLDF